MNHDSDIESYPLDDATIELMQETMQQWNAIRAFREGAISLFIRQQKLGQGNWHVADNQKELVRKVYDQGGLVAQPPTVGLPALTEPELSRNRHDQSQDDLDVEDKPHKGSPP